MTKFHIHICGAKEIVALAQFTLGPKVRAEVGYRRGHTIKVQVALRHSRGWLCPRHPWSPPKRKGKNGIGTVLGMTEHIRVDKKNPWIIWWQRIKEKLPLLPLNTLRQIEQYFSVFTTTPNHFEYGLMGQVSVLKSWTYTWTLDEGCRLI